MKHNFPKQSAYWLLKKNYSAASQQGPGAEHKSESSNWACLFHSFLCSQQRHWSKLGPGSGKAGPEPRAGARAGPQRARFLPEDWRWPFLPLDISVM